MDLEICIQNFDLAQGVLELVELLQNSIVISPKKRRSLLKTPPYFGCLHYFFLSSWQLLVL